MTITINFTIIKRHQNRAFRYSCTQVTTVLDRLHWEWNIDGMLLHFTKTFLDEDSAVGGRKEIESFLQSIHKRIGYRIDITSA